MSDFCLLYHPQKNPNILFKKHKTQGWQDVKNLTDIYLSCQSAGRETYRLSSVLHLLLKLFQLHFQDFLIRHIPRHLALSMKKLQDHVHFKFVTVNMGQVPIHWKWLCCESLEKQALLFRSQVSGTGLTLDLCNAKLIIMKKIS